MAIVNLLQWKRDRNRDLLSLSEQLAWETERKESLEKEQAYTEKIRVLSETLISKSIRWIELIRKSEFANDPNGIQLRRELETLVSFKSGVNAEIPILERDKAVEEALASFPELEDLSHTAKEAIILSVSGHKAKEIARLLDINEQYVRNLKSTAKRKLTPRFGSKFRWEDLPKLIQET